jgi:cyclic-di-GMP phosphodiesterase TipF (flagellum assembly factor)
LEDEEFFPQFIDFMLNNPELTNRLVFEFSEADIARQSSEVRGRLDALGKQGFAFSMDRVSDVRFNFVDLAARYFRFVKIDAATLIAGNYDIRSEDIGEAFKKFEIELIAEKIEDERTVLDILDFGVAYGQGYLFGEPRLSREPGEGDMSA